MNKSGNRDKKMNGNHENTGQVKISRRQKILTGHMGFLFN